MDNDNDIFGPFLPNPGGRDQPCMDLTDAAWWQGELSNFQRSLLSEMRDLLRLQEEALVSRLSGSQLPGPTSPSARSRIMDEPSRGISIPSMNPNSSEWNSNRVSFADVGKGRGVTPTTGENPESPRMNGVVGLPTSDTALNTSTTDSVKDEDEECVRLQVDGAFNQIFATSNAELDRPHYCVEMLYKTDGCAQCIARSSLFINFTLVIIALNAFYIGIDADWNTSPTLYDADWYFILFENLFCLYFTLELLIRFMAFQKKIDCMRDGWFRFDTILVFLTALETWVAAPVMKVVYNGSVTIPVGPLRLLRLLRLTRVTHLMRFLPELATMTKGMLRSTRAVCSSLVMVALMTYAFAIILNTCLKDDDEVNENLAPRNFVTIGSTMFTLLVEGTFMDPGEVLEELYFSKRLLPLLGCGILLLFILFSAVTVMNMLIGILCEVVSAVGQSAKDEAALKLVQESVLRHLKRFDNGDGMISREELSTVMNDKRSKAVLKGMRIDRLFLLELQSMLFPHADSQVSIKGIMELMLMCRGDLSVTVQHIASAQAVILSMMNKLEERLAHRLHHLGRAFSGHHVQRDMSAMTLQRDISAMTVGLDL